MVMSLAYVVICTSFGGSGMSEVYNVGDRTPFCGTPVLILFSFEYAIVLSTCLKCLLVSVWVYVCVSNIYCIKHLAHVQSYRYSALWRPWIVETFCDLVADVVQSSVC